MPDPDPIARQVIEVARQMIDRYGKAAARVARLRHEGHAQHGRAGAAAIWLRIVTAIEELEP